MVEFTQELRHYCRNPRCRMKLPAPVSNDREAFCCRGCYRQFYRFRCIVCEKAVRICGKRKCRIGLHTRSDLGCYHVPQRARGGIKSPEPMRPCQCVEAAKSVKHYVTAART